MKHRRLLQQDLARALGVSAPMVSRLKKQGMPTHAVAAAVEWRRRNLDPLHLHEQATRRGRADTAGGAALRAEPVDDGSQALEQVALLAQLAAADFDKWGERLRAAMAVLPRSRWDEVELPVDLWERLGGESFQIMNRDCAREREAAGAEASPSDDSGDGDHDPVFRGLLDGRDVAGDLVYMVAAGLARILPESSSADISTPQRDPE